MNEHHVDVARAAGRYLRRLREEAGLSLAQVLELLDEEGADVSASTLSRAEQGRTLLRVDIAQILVERLGGTLEELAEVVRAARGRPPTEEGEPVARDPGRLHEEARQAVESGRFREAMQLLEFLEARLDSADSTGIPPALLPAVRVDLGDVYRRLRMYERSRRTLGRALNSPDISPEDRVRGVLLFLALCNMTEDFFHAALFVEHARRLLADHQSSWLEAYGHAVIGAFHHLQAKYEDAADEYLAALDAYRRQDRVLQAMQVQASLADCLHHAGHRQRAFQLLREVIATCSSHGWKEAEARGRRTLGNLLRAEGRPDEARKEFSRAAILARQLGLRTELFLAIHGLWKVACEQHDETRARREAAVLRHMLPTVNPRLPEAREFRRRAAGHGRGGDR